MGEPEVDPDEDPEPPPEVDPEAVPEPEPPPLLDPDPDPLPDPEPELDPEPEPASGVPPSEAGLHGPQTPAVAPSGTTHVSPAQQSALIVHAPQIGTQAIDPQTNGGVPPALGTQGRLLQQSALDAHA